MKQPKQSRGQRLGNARSSPPARGVPKLHFQIDRLTMQGYSKGDQRRFVHSLERQLASLARHTAAWPAASRVLGSLEAIRLRPGASPEEASRLLARRIFSVFVSRGESGRNV